ncbi:MAG: LamG domain-containing protein [Planctomycetota bacterium]
MSLVAHYQFEDVYTDDSGNSHTLTPVGPLPEGLPTFVDGPAGRALSLNGSNQYATTPNIYAIDVHTGITLAARLNADSTAIEQSIIHRDSFSRMTFGLQVLAEGRVEYLYYRAETGSFTRVRSNDSVIVAGQWQHLAVTQSGNSVAIYLDGVAIGWFLHDGSLDSTNRKRSNRDTYIGSRSGGSRFFNGSLDEVGLYDHAMTAQEIAALASDDPDALPLAQHHGAAA